MKMKIPAALAALLLILGLAACGAESPADRVSRELGIDVSGGREISGFDTHCGNGDGTVCIALGFDDDSVLEEIMHSPDWKKLPPDETVRALVYGVPRGSGSLGPFLSDSDGNPLVPEIREGYCLLIDRQDDTRTHILSRYSFNFTLGLYDSGSGILYFCALDT